MVIDKREVSKHLFLIRTDDGNAYFRWYGRDILTFADFKDELKWRRRMLKHKITRKFFIWLFKKISNYIAKQMIKKYSEEDRKQLLHPTIDIEYNKNGFGINNEYDRRKYIYRLRFVDISIRGFSEAELYGKFITRVILEPYAIPWC